MKYSEKHSDRFSTWFNITLPHITFEKGEFIVEGYETPKSLYLMTAGRAKIYNTDADGNRSIIQFIGVGDLIGELELLDLTHMPREVVACSKVMCIEISIDTYGETLLVDTGFLRTLSEYLAIKLFKRTDTLSNNLKYPLKQRLAALIIEGSEDGIFNEMNTELAEFLGVSYRHLTYTYKILVDEGLIQKSKQSVTVLNSKALKILAGDISYI